ncbi:3-hydroxyanthranilate 3-4-dioxygenase 1 [Penicillium chermesinum]|uniref:3-hydroxyanthranilate 3-4-dioxygenase 1 n=1 Tax=Penicillium chermesinum TaxID=63820 RepID=A0A9W9NZR3_9EURO|nr:3-hydroxyanthranilate 3-4-dioxygenase 1 [Penicillium chermesinum]KAJ5232616.1 3-hydroxyanthranilate 3-4-dioxygenase 1 [Penicillium chermesinum]
MLPPALNIPKWLESNSHLLQPPVNNYCVYHPASPATAGYTVMIVGGPNSRTDYHINTTPEFFYQYRGSMLLKTDTVGVVMEQPRAEGAIDIMRWYCRKCTEVVWEKRFVCTDLGTQVKQVVEEFAADEDKRRCKACGEVASVKYAEGEVVQPPTHPE